LSSQIPFLRVSTMISSLKSPSSLVKPTIKLLMFPSVMLVTRGIPHLKTW
jgi:hypothetical protein